MFTKLTDSPVTLAGGLLCLVGLIILIAGLIAAQEKVWQAGLVVIGTGASLIGIFGRDHAASVRAHAEDEAAQARIRAAAIQQLKQEMQVVKEEAVGAATDAVAKLVLVDVPVLAQEAVHADIGVVEAGLLARIKAVEDAAARAIAQLRQNAS
jgi:hypothetical protein